MTEARLEKAYAGTRVLLTGHTGFKGSWLALWLHRLGAEVTGFALPPDTDPSLFEAIGPLRGGRHVEGDIRDLRALQDAWAESRPEIVFHLAAQPLVRRSYEDPVLTIATNVLGTAHVLEALRQCGGARAAVIVTTDKCYENREWPYGYREADRLGGHDPYAASKAAAELVAESYRRSFFPEERIDEHGVALATARAGNVIGGGDWARDRLVPDIVRALTRGERALVRNPAAVRPWQHVLEPLGGYLKLGAALLGHGPRARERYAGAWNFGPEWRDMVPVGDLVRAFVREWGEGTVEERPPDGAPHESGLLRLCTDKARALLGWAPSWPLPAAIAATVRWHRAFAAGATREDLRRLCEEQIDAFAAEAGEALHGW